MASVEVNPEKLRTGSKGIGYQYVAPQLRWFESLAMVDSVTMVASVAMVDSVAMVESVAMVASIAMVALVAMVASVAIVEPLPYSKCGSLTNNSTFEQGSVYG